MSQKKQLSEIALELTKLQREYVSSDFATLEGLNISKDEYNKWTKEPIFKWIEYFLSIEAITFDDIDKDYVKAAALVHSGYSYAEVELALSLDAGTILAWIGEEDTDEAGEFCYLLECAQKKKEIAVKEALTADSFKNICSNTNFRKDVACDIGRGDKIGDKIDRILDACDKKFMFTEDFTRDQAKSMLRESLRTCNPNDKKFNAKKYGAAYREGRLSYIRGMGDGLLRAFDKHISNLNFALEKATFNFNEGLTPKEYASLTKDLVTAVSLYQSIAEAHQPESENPYDILPAQDSELMLAEIEATETEAQAALPTPETALKALPETSEDTPTDEKK